MRLDIRVAADWIMAVSGNLHHREEQAELADRIGEAVIVRPAW
jgi:hypothetical protein